VQHDTAGSACRDHHRHRTRWSFVGDELHAQTAHRFVGDRFGPATLEIFDAITATAILVCRLFAGSGGSSRRDGEDQPRSTVFGENAVAGGDDHLRRPRPNNSP